MTAEAGHQVPVAVRSSGPRWPALSLRARLTVVATALVALALLAGTVLLLVALQRSLVAALDESARQRARDVAALVDSRQLPDPIPVAAGTPLVQVVDSEDRVRAASPGGDRLVPILLPDDVAAVRDGAVRTVDGARLGLSGQLRVVGEPAGADDPQTVLVAMSLTEVEGSLQVVRTAMLVGAPVLVAGFAVVCWLLVGSALRPVAALRRGAEEITSAQAAGRLPVPEAHDEVRRLSITLNGMLDRLERSGMRQRSFVADAAHELRSPLTAIRTQLEVARAHPDDADWEQTATDALTDVHRLSRLVDDLLVLARVEDGSTLRTREQVDLVEVVDGTLARTVSDASIRRVGDDHVVVSGDVDALTRIVANLVDNAARHARAEVTVDVRGGPGDGVTLTVADDGPGITAAARDSVFERFTRLDEARSRDAGGTGLGLPIVRELVRAHGGDVRLEDNGPGVRAVVRLPPTPP
ncbi:MAG TPA: ATP-binding protein [Jiangellaceae bacterium]|nr:ATP-binding protein [Jiangellaceae bacterium]